MRPLTWLRLLREGSFQVHPSRWSHLLGVSLAVPANTVLSGIQKLVFGRRLAAAELHGPPVFIIGHWRSGTTLLHELMVLDERYSSPSTFQCFAPHHFLVTEWIFQKFFRWLLPGKRPMDNMATGWDRPQEDEFALMNLGLPSPYRHIAFPNQPPRYLEYLDFNGVPRSELNVWLAGLKRFLLAVSTVTGRPLVIKSPTHTGRIAELANAFPDARFIHVTRDPRSLFPSTCRLWHSLADVQGLQVPRPYRAIEENALKDGTDNKTDPLAPEKQYVVDCFKRMYGAYLRDRDKIDPGRIVELRYEDLIADPVESLGSIYQRLRLSEFDSVRTTIEAWASREHRSYKVNRHQLSEADERLIREQWADYFEAYGYQ
ncbi:sulfotransferase [Roseiconus lacunae]|nr:sulfotransferase [Roseiconus lacunae]